MDTHRWRMIGRNRRGTYLTARNNNICLKAIMVGLMFQYSTAAKTLNESEFKKTKHAHLFPYCETLYLTNLCFFHGLCLRTTALRRSLKNRCKS